MLIGSLDHLVLTVADPKATCRFYETTLGMERIVFEGGRLALEFGNQKINLHQYGAEIAPHGRVPTPGSADLCFLTPIPIDEVMAHLERVGVAIELGPVPRTGATGLIESIYFRDPDGSLIEVANQVI